MSAKGKIVRLLSGLVLKRARVVEAAEVDGFRRLRVQGDVPHIAAGTKVQVLLPTDDMRTYTPIPSHEGMVLLGWTHAGGPGARYMAGVAVGDELAFVGPQRSLDLAPGPVVIVGDETSVAVAAAFEAERPGLVSAVIQADTDLSGAAASVGLRTIEVIRRADTAATAAAILKRLSSTPRAAWR